MNQNIRDFHEIRTFSGDFGITLSPAILKLKLSPEILELFSM